MSFARTVTNRSGQSTSLRSTLAILFRLYANWQVTGETCETDSVLLFSNDVHHFHPLFAFGMRTDPHLRANQFFTDAKRWFASRHKRQFVVVTADGQDDDLRYLLGRAGAKQLGRSERMQLLQNPSSLTQQGEQLTLSNFDEFLAVCASAFEYKPEYLDALFKERSRVMSSLVAGRLIYKDNTPVGAGIAIKTGSAITLDWIGTSPLYRGQGIALNCVRSLCSDVLFRGASPIVLSSTLAGRGVYEKVGFSEFGDVRLHLVSISTGA